MSVQFGRWNLAGEQASPEFALQLDSILAPHAPDRRGSYSSGGVEIFHRAFHTTKESLIECQPHVFGHGLVIAWDGRLDNRAELVGVLGGQLSTCSTDVAIAASAYECWGNRCFPKLTGDWALSIWNPADRTVTLAKDPVGARHLFYWRDKHEARWSTLLDPLVLFSNAPLAVDEEYLAGWISGFPASHRTPYVHIRSVPPASWIELRTDAEKITRYWNLDASAKIRYRHDRDYEEHFRTVFARSVARRLRSSAPVLAELSGGIDSSSIVCVADEIIRQGAAETPRLDTISYFDDTEPNWNERPFFAAIERKRGRSGCHVDASSETGLGLAFDGSRFRAAPAVAFRPAHFAAEVARCMKTHGNRVLLSGIGGDEFMGGFPTPAPELSDLLASGRFLALASRLKAWALAQRTPWHLLLAETARAFLPPELGGTPNHRKPAPWIAPDFVRRHRGAFMGHPRRSKFFGPLPSLQQSRATLEALGRQLGCLFPFAELPCERRYPYLDRDFLEFVCAIPRGQLVRPGQRRSLARRALAGIVPEAVLERRRKAYVARGPSVAISRDWELLAEMAEHMACASLEIVEPRPFRDALNRARLGLEVPIIPLLRTIALESWLQGVRDRIAPARENLRAAPPRLPAAETQRQSPAELANFDLS